MDEHFHLKPTKIEEKKEEKKKEKCDLISVGPYVKTTPRPKVEQESWTHSLLFVNRGKNNNNSDMNNDREAGAHWYFFRALLQPNGTISTCLTFTLTWKIWQKKI